MKAGHESDLLDSDVFHVWRQPGTDYAHATVIMAEGPVERLSVTSRGMSLVRCGLFDYGRVSGGSAALAHAILDAAVGEAAADMHYMKFMNALVARKSGPAWDVPVRGVRTWARAQAKGAESCRIRFQ